MLTGSVTTHDPGGAALSEATHELLLEDLHEDLLTPTEVTLIYRIPLATLRQWKRRGHLTPAAHDHLGRPLYLGIDVLRAEGAAAANARRTQVTNLATRRTSSGT